MKKPIPKFKKSEKHKGKKLFKFAIALIVLVALLAVGVSLISNDPKQETTAQISNPVNSTLQIANAEPQVADINIYELWQDANNERAKAGVGQLVLDPRLNQSAQMKCDDMVSQNYWSHDTPAGVQPWTFIDKVGIHYYKAAENLAYGYNSATATVAGWMNSPEHKDNMLDPAYTNVGFAVCKSPNYTNKGPQVIIVQHFIR